MINKLKPHKEIMYLRQLNPHIEVMGRGWIKLLNIARLMHAKKNNIDTKEIEYAIAYRKELDNDVMINQ